MKLFIQKYKFPISVLILVIFYTVGIVGLNISELRMELAALTPFTLLLTLALLLWNIESKTKTLWLSASVIYLAGFLVELIGVNTGFPFGDYTYGANLGWKIAGTPIIIGVNWTILIIASLAFLTRFTQNSVLLAIFGASIMTLLDYCIEPVAISLDFWSWDQQIIPLSNFIAWFIVAFSILLITTKLIKPATFKNQLGLVVLILQFIFFALV